MTAFDLTTSTRLKVSLLRDGARMPARQTSMASGYDLHACIEDGPLLITGTPVLVPTGIAIAAPEGIDVQIRPRSGLSSRGVIAILGTLDADYRGEVFVTMYCLPGCGPHEVHSGDRVAQLVVSRLVDVDWEPTTTLQETVRGAGGHGSTGMR